MSTQSHPIAPRRTYLIGRARPNAIVGKNRETGEIALIIGGAFLGMMSGLLVPVLSLRIVLLTGFPLLALAIVYVPYKHRTFYKWFEINRSFKRSLRRGTSYRSTAMEAGVSADGREVEIGPPPESAGSTGWPHRSGRTRSPYCCTPTAAPSPRPSRSRGPASGCATARTRKRSSTGSAPCSSTSPTGTASSPASRCWPAPCPPTPTPTPRTSPSAATRASGWLQESYEQLQSMVSTSSEQHRAYLVACMHFTRELAAEANAMARAARPHAGRKLDRDAGLAVVMARELTDICARLAEADIRVRQPLGQSRLASLVHSMYDPDHPIDHIQAMTKRNAWPAELDAVEPTFLQAKTRESSTRAPWCHSTAWVKEWPMTPVGVNFLAPLLVHTPDVIRTVAVTMDLEPTEIAIERMLTEKTNDEAEASRQAKMNRTVDPRDIAAHGRLDQRGEDLASGAAGVNLVGYITVSSRSPESLARDKRTIRASAGKSYLKLEWCDREHHRAFVNTLPFATGIRR